ncbi:hypothetical protein MIT9_P0045 [Methylomarinovum caldicuralii]|uniref:VWFA domain-containing protein n=1 Tax=Methylomarinovum caldicuralii TaxID=438856 RepID=A0AAU9CM07_9GAMM|nr:VWA domain-containing protein [Methylomarinovum caldicuralii]BCX80472.1 hypothetical protein MIT9_P0045 [Methylomarinovum caldicuralii]
MRSLALLLLLLCSAAVPAADAVRVLIDVSGSMKQTDPQDLRVPALKLLLELLPPETRAGVWLFADQPEPLLSPASVDDAWKRKAAAASAKIHSRGRYTDIEAALRAATADWDKAPEAGSRHLILLTDGMVDVEGGAAADQASRERLLGRLLPALQDRQVHLYTIALSDQADHALLKQLAVATDGWNETTRSAEQLQRVFLRIFKKVVPRDAVPLEGNRFKVDTSVREYTLLVFHQPDSPETELVKPSGEHWTAAQHPDNVRWHRESGYDLVTVTNPMPGEWQLVAKADPDNQVMIVTDLKLKVAPLPNYVLAGDSLTLVAELTEHGKRITEANFLRLVDFQFRRDTTAEPVPLFPGEETGTYTQTVTDLEPGTYTLQVTASSRTFERRREQSVEVITNPVRLETTLPHRPGEDAVLRLIPDLTVIDLHGFHATAVLENGDSRPFQSIGEGQWESRIPVGEAPVTVNLQVEATDSQGHSLPVAFTPLTLEVQPEEAPAEETATAEEEAVDEESLEEELLEEETESGHWWAAAAIAGGANLTLALAGFLLWRWLQRRARRQHEALLQRLGGT